MAVEIPVVIDIDKAFADAAARVPKAMAPLESSVNKLNDRLLKAQENLAKYKIGSKNWEKAAKEIQLVSQALAAADYQFRQFASNDGSIRKLSNTLAYLREQWANMGSKQKFDKKGNLSAEAQQVLANYKKVSAELERSGKTLEQMIQEEKRLIDLKKKGAQARQYENAILNTTVKTVRVLQEQERILTDRLNKATIGSSKYEQLRKQLQGVQKELQKAKGATDNYTASLARQSSVLGRLAGQFAAYVSIYSLLRFAKQIRDVTGELEYQRVALGHLIQDEEYGAQLFERIKAAAIESPFRIKDLVTYTKQLAAYRIEQEELFSTMTRLADISAGLGVDMNRLILAYGQVRAASVLRGQELRQFTEAGIPLVDMLAEKFTELNGKVVKTSDVFELISKRAVPFSMIAEIFEDLTEKGGMFYKMQEQQAATLAGRWEKLKDAYDIGLQAVGNTKTFEVYNNIILGTLNFLAKNLRLVPKLIEGASAAWLIYYAATTKARIATRQAAMAEIEEATAKEAQSIANVRGIKNVNAYTYALMRQRVATNALTRSFWKLWAAVVASPVAAAVAAVGAIAAALFLFRKRTDDAANSFQEFDELIEGTSAGLKEVQRFDKLITRYEILASKTELTDKESRRLYQTMSLLQEKFPEVGIGIDNESDALDVQIEKLRELNTQREEEIRLRGEQKLDAERIKREEVGKEIEKLYKKRQRLAENAARLERELAMNDLYLDSKEWKNAKKDIDDVNVSIAEQEELYDKLAKRIEALNRILHPELIESSLNAWQKQIQKMRDITVGDTTSPIFTDDEIEKWNTLDEALDAIAKRKKTVKEREDSLSASIKEQTGEIRDQIQSELDWAVAERVRLEAMEEFFASQSVYAKDIVDNFQGLLLKTYDKDAMKRLGEEMVAAFPKATADLLARPIIDAAKLVEKGWEDAGDGIATVFSSVYDFEDNKGKKHNIMVTPILPDGTVLSPDELDAYVQEIIASSDFKDEHGILLGIDVDEDAGEKLHQMQEEYYSLVALNEKLRGDSANKYLITEKELSVLDDATDVIDLIDKKIGEIDKEVESLANVELDPNISDEAKEEFENFKLDLQTIYEYFQELRGRYTSDVFSGLAKNVQSLFPNLMESAFSGSDKETFSKMGLFSNKDLKDITTIVDLYGLWSRKYKSVNEELEHYNKQLKETIDLELKEKIAATISSLEDQKKALEEMQKTYGFLLKSTGGGGYQQDPWILIYKNRTKFVQDFRKSVEDLDEYMAHSEALSKTRGIMSGRGAALGFDVDAMSGSRQEVLSWYDKTIEEITKKIQKLGGRTWAGLGVQAILAKDTKSRTLKAWQDLLADIFKERTDFDLSQQKADFEAAFIKMKDELKQSEIVRDFYNDILSSTGDAELATSLTVSVYGDVGNDLKERIQTMLNEAFNTFDVSDYDLWDKMRIAIKQQDWGFILKNLDKFSKEWRESVKEMASYSQQQDAKIVKNFADMVSKYGSSVQKIAVIRKRAENEITQIRQALTISLKNPELSEDQKKALRDQAEAIIRALEGQMNLDIFKESDDYIKFFSEINMMTTTEAATVRGQLRQAYLDAFKAGSIGADELRRNLRAVDEQFKKLNENANLFHSYMKDGLDGVIRRMTDYSDTLQVISAKMQRGDSLSSSETEWVNSMIKTFGKSFGGESMENIENLDGLMQSLGGDTAAAGEAMGGMAEGMASAGAEAASVIMIIELVVRAVNDLITSTQQIIDQLNEVRSEENKIGGWFDFVSDFNKYAVKGWNDLKSGNGFAVLADIAGSIISIINNIQKLKVKKLDDEIKNQQDIVKNLEKEYNRLEKAIKDSFGTDYIHNYNASLEKLMATATAYQLMADNERAKGKSADEDKAKSYEDMKYQIEEQIREMQDDLANFFSGTDVTSAAKSFAEAWIDAYKSFGNTTGAIKEKFKEMIDNMVINSLAAAIVQKQLQPIFDMIDKMSKEGEELSEKDIAAIAAETEKKTELINAELTALMQRLASAGINMRGTGNSLTGISKELAGASEQSINGLAAGINTQNFYMSYMPTISADVAAIRSAIEGKAPATSPNSNPVASVSTFGDETFRGQMQRIDENLADMRSMLKSVITPKAANTNTHCVGTK